MFVLSFLAYVFFGINIQNGIISFALLFSTYITLFIFSNKKLHLSTYTLLDFVVFLYVFLSLISIFQVYYFNNSFLVYLKGISYCLFPIIGYLVFSFSNFELNIDKINTYLKFILLTTIFTLVIGIYFYFFTPGIYVEYVLSVYEGLIIDQDLLFMARLLSYFGDPTVLGNISVISLPILIYLRRYDEKFQISNILYLLLFIILFSGTVLSFARSAWVAFFLYVLYLLVIDNKYFFLRISTAIFLILLILLSTQLKNLELDNMLLLELQKRIESLDSAFDERNSQIEYAISIISNSPLGVGLGQAGHKSFSGDTFKGVFDNNYLRVFAELGILGFFSLLLVVFISVYMSIRKSIHSAVNNLRNVLLVILLIFYFQAIGSNILDLHYSSFLFWSFLGILNWTYKCRPILYSK